MSYVIIRSEPQLWTVGSFYGGGKWDPASDHGSPEEAAEACRDLNVEGDGTAVDTWTAKQTEPTLWTVGFTRPDTERWEPESDHGSPHEARSRAAYLNGY